MARTQSPSATSPVRTILAGLCVFAAAFTAVAFAGRAAMPPSAPVIAVLDLEEALNGMNERTDKEAALKAQVDEAKKRLETMESDFKEEQERVKQMPTSPTKDSSLKGLRERAVRYEFEKQYNEKLFIESKADMLRDLYLKMSLAAGDMAKASGWTMVLASDQKAQIPRADFEGVQRAITLKRMLYVDPQMDVTADLITRMNNEYAAGGKGAAVAPATPPPAKGGSRPGR